jgi:immune inhibitor A
VDGRSVRWTKRAYVAEYRAGDGFDGSLADCYQWADEAAGWVDWFACAPGLHLIYTDAFYTDNDVATHIGHGGWMVVDAHPRPDAVGYDGGIGYWRPRIQVRDAAFGLTPTSPQVISFRDYENSLDGGQRTAPGKPAQPLFDDRRTYWYADAPEAGVKLPKNLGVRIRVLAVDAAGMVVRVENGR